jgi:quercetin dioxygenase-like cupin family protein
MVEVTGVSFLFTDKDYDLDYHNAPRRQYIIMLQDSVDVQTSDGEQRRFGPGDILLVEVMILYNCSGL